MKLKGFLILGVLVPFLFGCVRLYETPLLPLDSSVKPSATVNLRLSGFSLETREIVGSSMGFASATASGTAYNYQTGSTVNFNAYGSGTSSSLQFGDKTSEAVYLFLRDELENKGFYMQSERPDFILEGRVGGPYTKFNHNFWLEAPFVIGTLFIYYSLPSEGWCELRVYDSTRRFLKSYNSKELRLYRSLGIPFQQFGLDEALSPFARRRVVYSAANDCLNQFFEDVQKAELKLSENKPAKDAPSSK